MSRAEDLFLGSYPHELCETDFTNLLRRTKESYCHVSIWGVSILQQADGPLAQFLTLRTEPFSPDAVSLHPLWTLKCNLRILHMIRNGHREPWQKYTRRSKHLVGVLRFFNESGDLELVDYEEEVSKPTSKPRRPILDHETIKDIRFADQSTQVDRRNGSLLEVCFIAPVSSGIFIAPAGDAERAIISSPVTISTDCLIQLDRRVFRCDLDALWQLLRLLRLFPSSPCPYHLSFSRLRLLLRLTLLFSCSICQLW